VAEVTANGTEAAEGEVVPRPLLVEAGLTIAKLSALTIKAELGVELTVVLLRPKPAT
jgi:hypothetical protein